jgi:predicted nuclease of predicted toxin-antitoxin system
MKLALDQHYSTAIAEQLRAAGHDAVAAIEQGWEREEDESLLAICDREQRVLITNNVADYAVIAQRWAIQGRSHAGLIFTSDASLPRTRGTIGKYVELLTAVMIGRLEPHAWRDRIHWL